MRKPLLILATACLTLLASVSAAAQGTNAALSGTVTDGAGASVSGATITAQNTKTGIVTTTTTNEAGVYLFASLPPGPYQVTAEKSGFRKRVYNEVTLEISARVTLNLEMAVGDVAESVDVRADLDTSIALGTTSAGGVLSGQKVQDLPLPARDALGLVLTQAGVVGDNFAGTRIGSLNVTRDGINVMDQRINLGVNSTVFNSVDLVQEFRVVVSPADAEYGRGSGQVQLITRSGGNEFHGSVFESHRNTALNANTWFNNQRGTPRDVLIRNQFGGRVGGPIIKNRAFFHFLYEGQRQSTKGAVTSTVYTATARQGIFRFFPGVRNANANAAAPTVDLAGNPVKPAGATGDLRSVNLFNPVRDPNRSAFDNTGVVQGILNAIPLPNNFRVGDGLNTAGFTWSRPASDDFDNFNLRLDHSFNERHRLTYSYTKESGTSVNGFLAQPYPDSPGGIRETDDRFHSLSVVSTLSPNLLNELQVGGIRPRVRATAPWELEGGLDFLPTANSQPYLPVTVLATDPVNNSNDPQGRTSPLYQVSNKLSWLRGQHAFKGGFELRFVSTNGFNSFDVLPRVNFGQGGAGIQGINSGEFGTNTTTARNLLYDLAGSVASIDQSFNARLDTDLSYVPGAYKQRTWRQREVGVFFKDDYKFRPSLSLNLGIRWEYYGVPYEARGNTAALAGGSPSIFGISGTGTDALFKPGASGGGLTRVELVGPNSPNSDRQLYRDDWNNFAPAVGFSWAIPYLGEKPTVLRMGYGIGYERQALRLVDVVSGDQPGLNTDVTFASSAYLNLGRITLPLTPAGRPLELVPLTDRTQFIRTFDSNLRTPYVQNWNVSLQREVLRDMFVELRYVGSKGTKLIRSIDVNENNIFENGILEAFRLTQTGGHAPLLDQIFRGLTVAGLPGRVGETVGGVTVTGSDLVRANGNTQGFLAQNNVGGFANYLHTSIQFTGERGGLLRRAGLPENFIVVNPQFGSARLVSNFANSTYHSAQIDVVKRFSGGWTYQGNYTFSKALGEEDGDSQDLNDSYRTIRNMRLDKRLLGFHLTHVFRNSGTYELPFGPGKRFLGTTNSIISRLVGGWQVGGIFNVFSGSPLVVTGNVSSFNQISADNTPLLVGALPKGFGRAQVVGNRVVYFGGLQQVADPSIANLTTKNGIRGLSTLLALADGSGNVILSNATPGVLGNLGTTYLQGPGSFRLDVNLIKRIKLTEGTTLELRADAIDVTNTPQWNDPTEANLNINSPNFGQITGATGNRIVVVAARINF